MGKDWRFRKEALVRWEDGQCSGNCSCSVLVVDDDETVCRALSRIVGRLGCQSRQATSSAGGLELVAREAPDIILLDLQMLEMNGPQFLEALRRTHPGLPVVIVTGYPDGELMNQALQYAPLMVLAKPVDPELLKRTVRTAVGEKMTTTRSAGRSRRCQTAPTSSPGPASAWPSFNG